MRIQGQLEGTRELIIDREDLRAKSKKIYFLLTTILGGDRVKILIYLSSGDKVYRELAIHLFGTVRRGDAQYSRCEPHIKTLGEAGLIEATGKGPGMIIKLTALGREVITWKSKFQESNEYIQEIGDWQTRNRSMWEYAVLWIAENCHSRTNRWPTGKELGETISGGNKKTIIGVLRFLEEKELIDTFEQEIMSGSRRVKAKSIKITKKGRKFLELFNQLSDEWGKNDLHQKMTLPKELGDNELPQGLEETTILRPLEAENDREDRLKVLKKEQKEIEEIIEKREVVEFLMTFFAPFIQEEKHPPLIDMLTQLQATEGRTINELGLIFKKFKLPIRTIRGRIAELVRIGVVRENTKTPPIKYKPTANGDDIIETYEQIQIDQTDRKRVAMIQSKSSLQRKQAYGFLKILTIGEQHKVEFKDEEIISALREGSWLDSTSRTAFIQGLEKQGLIEKRLAKENSHIITEQGLIAIDIIEAAVDEYLEIRETSGGIPEQHGELTREIIDLGKQLQAESFRVEEEWGNPVPDIKLDLKDGKKEDVYENDKILEEIQTLTENVTLEIMTVLYKKEGKSTIQEICAATRSQYGNTLTRLHAHEQYLDILKKTNTLFVSLKRSARPRVFAYCVSTDIVIQRVRENHEALFKILSTNQTVYQILYTLYKREPLNQTEINRILNRDPNSTWRGVKQLTGSNLIHRKESTKKYSLTLKGVQLVHSINALVAAVKKTRAQSTEEAYLKILLEEYKKETGKWITERAAKREEKERRKRNRPQLAEEQLRSVLGSEYTEDRGIALNLLMAFYPHIVPPEAFGDPLVRASIIVPLLRKRIEIAGKKWPLVVKKAEGFIIKKEVMEELTRISRGEPPIIEDEPVVENAKPQAAPNRKRGVAEIIEGLAPGDRAQFNFLKRLLQPEGLSGLTFEELSNRLTTVTPVKVAALESTLKKFTIKKLLNENNGFWTLVEQD